MHTSRLGKVFGVGLASVLGANASGQYSSNIDSTHLSLTERYYSRESHLSLPEPLSTEEKATCAVLLGLTAAGSAYASYHFISKERRPRRRLSR